MKSFLKYVAPLLASAFIAGPASAVVELTITDVSDRNTNNPEDIQCIIFGNSCPGGFQAMDANDYTQKGSIDTYDELAAPNTDGNNDDAYDPTKDAVTPYTVAYLEHFVGSVFGIGIDVNTAGGQPAELLLDFEVWVDGKLEFNYTAPAGGYLLDPAFNGNGYFDFTLQTIDLSGFADDAVVQFRANWSRATDGAENFFVFRLTNDCVGDECFSEAPEPGSIALIGLALAGLGLARRRLR